MNFARNKTNYRVVFWDKFNLVNTFLTEVARDINTFVPGNPQPSQFTSQSLLLKLTRDKIIPGKTNIYRKCIVKIQRILIGLTDHLQSL